MRNRLTVRATLALVAVAFAVSLAIQPLLGGESSAGKPAVQDRAGFVTGAPGPNVALSLAAVRQVPALREARKKKRTVRAVVTAAPKVSPTPTAPAATVTPTPTPTPTAAPPRAIPPAPAPTPAAPRPTPAPTSTPPDAGEFDTTGETGDTAEP